VISGRVAAMGGGMGRGHQGRSATQRGGEVNSFKWGWWVRRGLRDPHGERILADMGFPMVNGGISGVEMYTIDVRELRPLTF